MELIIALWILSVVFCSYDHFRLFGGDFKEAPILAKIFFVLCIFFGVLSPFIVIEVIMKEFMSIDLGPY